MSRVGTYVIYVYIYTSSIERKVYELQGTNIYRCSRIVARAVPERVKWRALISARGRSHASEPPQRLAFSLLSILL